MQRIRSTTPTGIDVGSVLVFTVTYSPSTGVQLQKCWWFHLAIWIPPSPRNWYAEERLLSVAVESYIRKLYKKLLARVVRSVFLKESLRALTKGFLSSFVKNLQILISWLKKKLWDKHSARHRVMTERRRYNPSDGHIYVLPKHCKVEKSWFSNEY